MIVDGQTNLKVHFAGLENIAFAQTIVLCGGVRYGLFTVFPYIADKLGIKGASFGNNRGAMATKWLTNNLNHVIMDSGLFTLMFGAHASKRDADFMWRWYNELCDFVDRVGFSGTVVEVDCQKILGVDDAWRFREAMRDRLPNNRQINVLHLDDGRKGLDRMIEFSDYIAISVPELRAAKKRDYILSIAHYIKNRKPEIDIHLLGCTEKKLLKTMNFCTSSDSTSWIAMNSYGEMKFETNGEKYSKSVRMVDYYAARLQIQERLTSQIADVIYEALCEDAEPPLGIILVMEAEHLCKTMRGAKKKGKMRTAYVKGLFKEDNKARSEFMSHIANLK